MREFKGKQGAVGHSVKCEALSSWHLLAGRDLAKA